LTRALNYDSPNALRAYLDEHGLGMQKKFGQNFLIHPALRRELAEALGIRNGDEVWEIGPGLGSMTFELLSLGGRVTAFEIDQGFVRALAELFSGSERLTVIPGDVRKTWPLETRRAPYLFGNLPYNVGSLILGEMIEAGCVFDRAVVTVQKEVAQRMSAAAGSKEYSSFSVLCASVYRAELLKPIKASSFYPAPRVDSQAVRLSRRTGTTQYPPAFTPLVRFLFASRRKTLRNSLTKFLDSRIMESGGTARQRAGELLEASGISGSERPENLTVEEFAVLAGLIGENGA
jgi:16S rRNA (adenine1518-N6/adenine1519-N6)-dimethyltransferase